jgi:very-short-patch-repair endonuclease
MCRQRQRNCHYNRRLRPLAHTLRGNMTKAEASLWKYVLRARNMKGYLFRRQRPVLQYIVDFMCPELKLVIKIDGISHETEDDQEKDRQKDRELSLAGYRIMRILNEDILQRLDEVRSDIEDVVEEINASTPGHAETRGHPRQRGTEEPETIRI